jgi:hypothetical protein
MGGGMEHAIGSRKMGAEGNPPLALRRSIDLALTRNQAGQHVNYGEIYEADVLPIVCMVQRAPGVGLATICNRSCN